MTTLFDPITLGAVTAPNRILMSPLTRARATRAHVPTPVMAQYYAQRASAGLIISEAIGISVEGLGWPYAPGLWSDEQVAAWKPVTAAVHAAGGRIAAQLWHMGRVVHPSMGGGAPVSASATTAPGEAHTYDGKQANVQAKALSVEEIARVVEDYVRAARRAMDAGFDMVQVHGANGYLVDQFLRDSSNQRTDAYGGAPGNRIRFLMDVMGALARECGASRVAVRLSPDALSNGVQDSNPAAVFDPAARALSELGIAFLEVREPGDGPATAPTTAVIRAAFRGPLVINSGYTFDKATTALAEGRADAVAFGKSFLANPDLPRRFAERLPLNPPDVRTFYTQGPEGYIDYPPA